MPVGEPAPHLADTVEASQRQQVAVLAVETTKDGGIQAVVRVTVEIEGGDRPGCVIDTISRYYPADG